MVRISRGRHDHQTALANDPTKDISANQWNDVGSPAHIETGIFGFPISVSSVSLASNVIVPVDSLTVVKASSGTSDTMSFIDTVGNDDVDILWFTPFSGHTITLTNNAASPPANTGVIITLSGANKVLDPNVPTLLIRRGSTFYEYSINTSIVNANISASAGIAYSKLNLSGSILNSDISVSASISASKINGTAGVLNGNQTWTGSNIFSGTLTMSSANLAMGANSITGNFVVTGTPLFNAGLTINTNAQPYTITRDSISGLLSFSSSQAGFTGYTFLTSTVLNTPTPVMTLGTSGTLVILSGQGIYFDGVASGDIINGSTINIIYSGSLIQLLGANVKIGSLIANYNGITTAGKGIAAIYGTPTLGTSLGTGVGTTIASYTAGSTGMYRVSVAISCKTTETVTVNISYVDPQAGTITTQTIYTKAMTGGTTDTVTFNLWCTTGNAITVKGISGTALGDAYGSATIEQLQ